MFLPSSASGGFSHVMKHIRNSLQKMLRCGSHGREPSVGMRLLKDYVNQSLSKRIRSSPETASETC